MKIRRWYSGELWPSPLKNPCSLPQAGELVVAQNRAAVTIYLLERTEAGIVLHGTEVKALRQGKANIRDAFGTSNPRDPGW